jgi:DNA-binding CsgD family transcriptional regulator
VERLTTGDLRRFSESLRTLYAVEEPTAFPGHALQVLRTIVPSESAAYAQINTTEWRDTAQIDPAGYALPPGFMDGYERHLAEHPLVTYYLRHRDDPVLKLSDFLSRRQFHDLGLYQDAYRLVDVEHQIGFRLRMAPPLLVGYALSRRRTDFSRRERQLLELVRPHVVQAFQNTLALSRYRRQLELAVRGVAALDRELVLLDGQGRPPVWTPRARAWLDEWFGVTGRGRARLPDALVRWLGTRARGAPGGDPRDVRAPLVLERAGRRLVVRAVTDAGSTGLLLHVQPTAVTADALAPLGLTRREAEVLALVAEGKTNPEIATILGMRRRTAAKHLERVHRKLGVETRGAAAACAFAVAGGATP